MVGGEFSRMLKMILHGANEELKRVCLCVWYMYGCMICVCVYVWVYDLCVCVCVLLGVCTGGKRSGSWILKVLSFGELASR